MRQRSSLPKPLLAVALAVCAGGLGCGRKGDPIPRPRAAARAVQARLAELRAVEAKLPTQDVDGADLVGIEALRVYYAPLHLARPAAEEVVAKGEVVLERRRPDLAGPGRTVRLDLRSVQRPAGWIVVVAVRLGNVMGQPSEPMPWLDPGI